jgi:hypothetical protein
MSYDLLVVDIDEDQERGRLASLRHLKMNEDWKKQMQPWTYAMLQDGICAGGGRDFRTKKCLTDRF